MKRGLTILALLASIAGAAHAETPYERDQREQLEKAQREGTLSPQVAQRLRWEQEWRTQHPGEPMPNPGQMQKLHRDEIIANTNAGFAKMRAPRVGRRLAVRRRAATDGCVWHQYSYCDSLM